MSKTLKDLGKNILRPDVNSNLEHTFDMAPTEKQSEQAVVVKEKRTPYAVKAPGRGGARKNSGRKKGSTQKLSGTSILDAIAHIDMPFEEGLALDYKRARDEGDLHVIQRYQTMILAKVVADKQELDITSNGQTLGASFTFPTIELPEWQDDTTKH